MRPRACCGGTRERSPRHPRLETGSAGRPPPPRRCRWDCRRARRRRDGPFGRRKKEETRLARRGRARTPTRARDDVARRGFGVTKAANTGSAGLNPRSGGGRPPSQENGRVGVPRVRRGSRRTLRRVHRARRDAASLGRARRPVTSDETSLSLSSERCVLVTFKKNFNRLNADPPPRLASSGPGRPPHNLDTCFAPRVDTFAYLSAGPTH